MRRLRPEAAALGAELIKTGDAGWKLVRGLMPATQAKKKAGETGPLIKQPRLII
jgi:hypothetical protein